MATNKIKNGFGYPDAKKEGGYFWVKSHYQDDWEICIWDGWCFLGYGLQTFERKIPLPSEWQEIKKPK